MKLYISGQITGLSPEEFKACFSRAETVVQRAGFDTFNPLTVEACLDLSCGGKVLRDAQGSYEHSWECYLKYDLIELLRCDGICLLANWRKSHGAKFELDVSIRSGLAIFFLTPENEVVRMG